MIRVITIFKIIPTILMLISGYLIVPSVVSVSTGGGTNIQTERWKQTVEYVDRQDVRISKVESDVVDLKIDVVKLQSSVDVISTELGWGIRILGGIGTVLLGQLATRIFGTANRRHPVPNGTNPNPPTIHS